MYRDKMESLARGGTLGDVKLLLSMHGKDRFGEDFYSGTPCIDVIAECVLDSTYQKEEKTALVSDYINKTGAFGEQQEITPDIVKEFRDAIADLKLQVRELQEAAAQNAAKELRDAIRIVSSPASARPQP